MEGVKKSLQFMGESCLAMLGLIPFLDTCILVSRIKEGGKVHTQGPENASVRSHILGHLIRNCCKRVTMRRLFQESRSTSGRIWNCGTNNDRTSRPYTQPLAITDRPLAANGPTIDKGARAGSSVKNARHPVGPAHCMCTSLRCPQHFEL